MSPPEAALYSFGNYKTPIERLALFSMIFTAGILSFVKAFLEDALDGTRCLRDRDSAMIVGRFPWILTRFTGHRWDKRLLSFVSRTTLALHPIIYLFVPRETITWYDWLLGGIILVFSCWILLLSQQYQRPILFDSKTEFYKKRDLNTLTNQLEELLDEIQKSDQVQKINQPKQAPQLKPHQRKKILETLMPAKQHMTASK